MNRRVLNFILVILLLTSLIFTGCTKTLDKSYSTLIVDDYNGIDIQGINKYVLDIEFDPDEKTYIGKQITTYVNNTGKELDTIYFHTYPNAFNRKETAPFLGEDLDGAYPSGFEPGYIKISKLKISGDDGKFSLQGVGNVILKISLKKPLLPGEKIKIYMEYIGKLPPAVERFGYGENIYNFGNWYPILCIYNEKGWHLDPYYALGDPFFSDISNYEVTITTPKDIVIASSGNILSEKIKQDKKVWKIEGKLIRDFAWVASNDFVVGERDVDGTLVKSYVPKDKEDMLDYSLDVTEKAIKVFNENFGKYPYGQYSVVGTNFPGGMEYPGLVYIGDDYYTDSNRYGLEIVIAHETAHQWWYGVVGNNQVQEPWLDESFATYSEVIYIEEVYGYNYGLRYYNDGTSTYYNTMKSLYDLDDIVVKPLDKFKDWNDYGPLVYSRGSMLLNSIKEDYGKDVLYDILKEYYNRYRFKISNTEKFIKVCEDITGEDFADRANKWLYGKD